MDDMFSIISEVGPCWMERAHRAYRRQQRLGRNPNDMVSDTETSYITNLMQSNPKLRSWLNNNSSSTGHYVFKQGRYAQSAKGGPLCNENKNQAPNSSHLNPPQISPKASSFFWLGAVENGVLNKSGAGAADDEADPHTSFVLKRFACCCWCPGVGLPHRLPWAGGMMAAGVPVHPELAPHAPAPLFPIMLVGCCICTCCCWGWTLPHGEAWAPPN